VGKPVKCFCKKIFAAGAGGHSHLLFLDDQGDAIRHFSRYFLLYFYLLF